MASPPTNCALKHTPARQRNTTVQNIVFDLKPTVAGEVLSLDADLEAVSSDFGGIVHRLPRVRVRPLDSADIAQVVRYAREQQLTITCRAQGHSLGGQCLNQDGILLDMSQYNTLQKIEQKNGLFFTAAAGTTWRQVLNAALPQQLCPPVVTNYADVSVGGTHSTGGMGASSFRFGSQADNCTGLEVVTGEGEIVRCSHAENRELFEHVLGGFGHFGIISQVQHRLRKCPPQTRTYTLLYDDLDALVADMKTLTSEERVDYLVAVPAVNIQGLARSGGLRPLVGWFYSLQITVEYENLDALDDGQLLAGLHFYRRVWTEDLPFEEFILPAIPFDTSPGTANPWMDMFLSANPATQYIKLALEQITTFLDFTRTPMGAFCLQKSRISLPLIRLPEEEFVVGFGVYPTIPAAHLDFVLKGLNQISNAGLELGGRRYLIGQLQFDSAQWHHHFGEYWQTIKALKQKYDPFSVLQSPFSTF